MLFFSNFCAIVCGRDGRQPFPPEIEVNILTEVAEGKPWPCFRDSADPTLRNVGIKGIRDFAYHQKQKFSLLHSTRTCSTTRIQPHPSHEISSTSPAARSKRPRLDFENTPGLEHLPTDADEHWSIQSDPVDSDSVFDLAVKRLSLDFDISEEVSDLTSESCFDFLEDLEVDSFGNVEQIAASSCQSFELSKIPLEIKSLLC